MIPDPSDVVADESGQVDNFVTGSSTSGVWTRCLNGLDVSAGARRASFTFAGGTSTGRTVTDNGDVRGWLQPLTILTPRLVKIAAAIDF